jgi:hypothetical protein
MGYYKLHTTPRTWDEAWRRCAEEGAHLAIINSEAEARLLQLLFSRQPKITGSNHNDYAFLGVHDILIEGQFMTIFGENVPGVLVQGLLTSGLFGHYSRLSPQFYISHQRSALYTPKQR